MPVERKQLIIIIGAVVTGIIAVVLTSNYVNNTIQGQTQKLAEEYTAKQKEMTAQMQQQTAEIKQQSSQQMAALAQELERVKTQQAEAIQKQIAAAQQAAPQAKARKPSLALKTPVGKRAVTVKIDSLSAVGGLLNPGDLVDVIAQLNVPSSDAKKTVTAMIFQSLQVLAINTNGEDQGAYDEQQAAPELKITFAVDPQEAGLLSFADKNGNLELALRSPDDTEHQTVKANTWKTLAEYVLENQGLDIRNPDQTSEDSPLPEEKTNIQIFRGGKEL